MNIIITGASKGIGFEIIKQLSKNKEHTIIGISRNINKIEELKNSNKNSNIIPIALDLVEISSNSGFFIQQIKQLSDKIDILINNAGYLEKKPFTEISEEGKRRIFEVNFFAPSKLIEILLPVLNKPSHIVNIGSMSGFQGSSKFPGLSYYSASKAALAVLTECLAVELKEHKVFCNCLSLGSTQTEMFQLAFPGIKAPLNASEMAEFVIYFAMNGHKYFNGKVIPVALSTP